MKKFYKKDDNGELVYTKRDGGLFPIVAGVKVLTMSSDGKQHFTPKKISQGILEGWLKFDNDYVYINDLKFKVIAVPGRYHVITGEKLPDDPEGRLARAYITKNFTKGDEYICNNYYACELEK